MKRPIKFRGREFFSKKFVYGQTIRETDDGFDIWNGEDWVHVTDTLEQFIGTDANDNEVYEGDKVIRVPEDEKLFPMAATFDDFTAINSGEIILVEAKQ